jgi:ABC-2 type transport system permease protein
VTVEPVGGNTGIGGERTPTGSIYDLGYRGYEGPRLGRRAAVWALVAHSTRTAYGLGRSARSKLWPVGLAVLAVLPSVLALGILMLISTLGAPGEAIEAISPVRYNTMFPIIALLVFLFCAGQAPELFGRDQGSGILPLYFSRAVGRLDYALARLLGLGISLLVLVFVPYLLLLVGRVMVALDPLEGLADELPSLPAAVLMGLFIGAVVSSISAAVASLTPRRAYATAAIIGIFLIPNIAASMLVRLDTGTIGQVAVLLSPPDVLDGVNAYLFDARPDNLIVRSAFIDGPTYVVAALAWVAGSLSVLTWRFRTIEA